MGRKERLKGAAIACSSTLVMIIVGWLLWIRADVAAENQRESILTTTGRLAAYERLYSYAEQHRDTTMHAENRVQYLRVQLKILDAIAAEQD